MTFWAVWVLLCMKYGMKLEKNVFKQLLQNFGMKRDVQFYQFLNDTTRALYKAIWLPCCQFFSSPQTKPFFWFYLFQKSILIRHLFRFVLFWPGRVQHHNTEYIFQNELEIKSNRCTFWHLQVLKSMSEKSHLHFWSVVVL